MVCVRRPDGGSWGRGTDWDLAGGFAPVALAVAVALVVRRSRSAGR